MPGDPGRVRRIPPRKACGAIPPTSTTSRPGSTSRPSSPRGRQWFTAHRQRRAPAPRSFRWSARSRTPAWSRCRSAPRSARSSTTSAAAAVHGHSVKAVQTGGPSGGCIPHDMFDTPVDLRIAGQARLHHGFGRHGGDGRRQLHGRRRPLLHRVHPLRIVRQMHAVPRRTGQGTADPHAHHRGRRPRGGPGRAGRAGPDDPRHLAVRSGPVGAQLRCSPRCATSATSSRTTSAPSAAAPASVRNWRSRLARTVARCT